jgi:hypothetical protein
MRLSEINQLAARGIADAARSRAEDYRMHAEFHARESRAGIGAAVLFSAFEDGRHVWDCIVSDGREWHYIRVLGPDLGPYPNLSGEDVEQAVERFAETLPAQDRLRHLLNANPLHIDRDGNARD